MRHPDTKNSGFAVWWGRLWALDCVRGTDLVYDLTGTDSTARADKLLTWLEENNYIIRGKLDLTDRSTQAFISLERPNPSYRYPREYAWMPNRQNPEAKNLLK